MEDKPVGGTPVEPRPDVIASEGQGLPSRTLKRAGVREAPPPALDLTRLPVDELEEASPESSSERPESTYTPLSASTGINEGDFGSSDLRSPSSAVSDGFESGDELRLDSPRESGFRGAVAGSPLKTQAVADIERDTDWSEVGLSFNWLRALMGRSGK